MMCEILQNKFRNLAVITASALALAACGGGGGGDHGGGGGLASGTFTRTFAGAAASSNIIPFGITFADMTYQGLYFAADLRAAGKITMLRFQHGAAHGQVTCPNTTIRLGHTSVGALTTTFATNINQGSALIVFNNATLTIPAGAEPTWFDIPLTTPFDYNGVDNLVVQVDRTTACSADVGVTRGGAASTRAFSSAADTVPGTANNDTTTATSVDTAVASMQFVFAGGDNRVEFGGTNIAANSNSFPWSANKRTQHLYLASEINGSGPITGIAFQANFQNTLAATYTYTLRLGHTTLSALGDTFDSNFAGAPTTVANAVANFSIPANIPPGEWFWVPIPDGIFTYNGTDNLVVEVSVPVGTNLNYVRMFPGAAGRRLFNNSNAAAATGTVDTDTYHIALRFHGGYVAKMSAGVGNSNGQFNNLFSTAVLYSATDLGTGGSITSVSCRMFAPSTAASYADFRVVIGHATGSTLSGTTATDFVSQNTVFSGTFPVPAGLAAGDWLDIPLSTPFAYDGKSNLIIWMGNGGTPPGTATINSCRAENNATRYPSGMGLSNTGVGSPTFNFGVISWTQDLRMTIQK